MKKKTSSKTLIHRLSGRVVDKTPTQSNSCLSTPSSLPAMELICPSKQKVCISANAIENTPCKQIHRQDGTNY